MCKVAEWCLEPHLCENCDGCAGQFEDIEYALETDLPLLYSPYTNTAPEHPIQIARRLKRATERKEAALARKSETVRKKRALQNQARRNERETSRAVVRATVASGSVAGDGDARFGEGYLGFDYKLQTKATSQFTVKIDEVDKAWRQQRNIIVITTANGERFAVARLEQFIQFAEEIAATKEGVRELPS